MNAIDANADLERLIKDDRDLDARLEAGRAAIQAAQGVMQGQLDQLAQRDQARGEQLTLIGRDIAQLQVGYNSLEQAVAQVASNLEGQEQRVAQVQTEQAQIAQEAQEGLRQTQLEIDIMEENAQESTLQKLARKVKEECCFYFKRTCLFTFTTVAGAFGSSAALDMNGGYGAAAGALVGGVAIWAWNRCTGQQCCPC